MGQSEFYDNIKNKLEARRLSPSDGAWDKLEVMLDNKDRSVIRRQYKRFFIAASLLLLFGLSYLFLSQKETVSVNQSFVNETIETQTITIDQQNDIVVEQIVQEQDEVGVMDEEHVQKKLAQRQQIGKEVNNNKIGISDQSSSELVAINSVQNSVEKHVVTAEDSVLPNKVVRDVDAEVEALLAAAMRKLPAKDKVDKKDREQSFYEVDEKALLATVEEELDVSFKEKIFKKIKEGFQKTKTAVVKRNQDDLQNH